MTDQNESQNPPQQQRKDNIYATPQKVDAFRFDASVADVFADMIERSVPGYSKIIQMIEVIAQHQAKPGGQYYDLGCSLGASTLAMRHGVSKGLLGQSIAETKIIGIDNSSAMVERCQGFINRDPAPIQVELRCQDIVDTPILDAEMVTLNFTLQFVKPESRLSLLKGIYAGLNEGGALVLSEKVVFQDEAQQNILQSLHYDFKAANGYSDMEISQKRSALENVLIPETIDCHKQRLNKAGFSRAEVWFQCFNFISLIAYK